DVRVGESEYPASLAERFPRRGAELRADVLAAHARSRRAGPPRRARGGGGGAFPEDLRSARGLGERRDAVVGAQHRAPSARPEARIEPREEATERRIEAPELVPRLPRVGTEDVAHV